MLFRTHDIQKIGFRAHERYDILINDPGGGYGIIAEVEIPSTARLVGVSDIIPDPERADTITEVFHKASQGWGWSQTQRMVGRARDYDKKRQIRTSK